MNHPAALPENSGFVFPGETAWPPSLLTLPQAEKLAATPNSCGRPNSDVLRRRLAVVEGEPTEGWQIDFPAHFTTPEAALYENPFDQIRQHSADSGWLNPHANPALRRSLARVSRYLAVPVGAIVPDWRWIEEALLPDATLLVVARDDDFTHGVLQSHPFAVWWQKWNSPLPTDSIVGSFPFPWRPATLLSSLSVVQEEQRHAIARSARSGDTEQLNSSVLAAYGWSTDLDETELLQKLSVLNRERAG